MVKCTFCGNVIPPGTGKIFVQKSGKQTFLCSNKCDKNMFKLKRSPLNVKWSKYYKKE